MIDQKDVIQLIGNWGHTPKSLENYVYAQRKRASKIGDSVGVSAYATLLALCRYAQSANANQSIHINLAKDRGPEWLKMFHNELDEMIGDNPNFAINVIETTYTNIVSCNTFEEAERAIRLHVFSMVGDFIFSQVTRTGIDLSKDILQFFVGCDSNLRDTRPNNEENPEIIRLIREASNAYLKLARGACAHLERIRNQTDPVSRKFIEVSDNLLGDFREMSACILQDMLSILDNPPHRWSEYSLNYGLMSSIMQLAVFMGLVNYDDYDVLIDEFQKAGLSAKAKSDMNVRAAFGRN